jgi:hypothetical protein
MSKENHPENLDEADSLLKISKKEKKDRELN